MMGNSIKGRNPVLEALRSGRPIIKIMVARNVERHSAIAEILHLAKTGGIPLEFVERQVIDRRSETGGSQGILAFAAAREYVDLEDLLENLRKDVKPALLVILDGIEDPHNLGAIIRTADATGVQGIIVREKRAVGLTPAVEKAASGALEYVPVARVTNISRTIETLKRHHFWIAGIDRRGETDYTQVDYKPATAIVLGGEGAGISRLVFKNCDFVVSIPMVGKINSLNASVAAAVVMYEALKQRRAPGLSLIS
jgi:23S rRNA (guanosine2251-2'-O)-methyltransferase